MEKNVLILPYFGKLKPYFDLFLLSFSYNKSFDLLIITDQNTDLYVIPNNVIVINTTFDLLRDFIASKFDFNIDLDRPYKLCDFKPAYGYIFFEKIKEYKYWGHCDCDIIFGDLSIINRIIDKYNPDKIFANGHLTMYKNNENNNLYFMTKYNNEFLYKEAFSTNKIYGFDEGGFNFKNELKSVHEIFFNSKQKIVYTDDLSFNISTNYFNFINEKYDENIKGWIQSEKAVLVWDKGKLFGILNNNIKKEYLYAHFQSRKMVCRYKKNDTITKIYIRPNKFITNFKKIKYKKYFCFIGIKYFYKREYFYFKKGWVKNDK